MKTLIIYGHPHPEQSNANKQLIKAVRENSVDVLTLIEKYPTGEFEVEYEQERLLNYDQIILQFPFYWYSAPYIMKKYLDEVFVAGYAFNGAVAGKLTGKILKIAITTGASKQSYVPGGYNNEHPTTFLKPFTQMADKMGMVYKPASIVYDAVIDATIKSEKIKSEYLEFILN